MLLGDINAHNPEWNLNFDKIRDAASLKALVERHNLILNESGRATRLT